MKKEYLYSLFFSLFVYLPFCTRAPLVINLCLLALLILSFVSQKYYKIHSYIVHILLVVSVGVYWLEYGTLRSIEGGVFLLSLLTLVKTFEIESRRDYFLFLLIVILQLVGHMLNTESISLVLYCLALLSLMFASMVKVRFEREHSFNTFGLLKKYLVFSIPLTLLFFFLFPRLQMNSFFIGKLNNQGKSGFSKELNPGDISKLALSDETVFRARIDETSEIEGLYWRGTIYHENEGLKWKQGKIARDEFKRGTNESKYRVSFDNYDNGHVFTLEDTYRIKSLSAAREFRGSGKNFLLFSYRDEKLRFTGHRSKGLLYYPAKENLDKYLQIPSGSERFKSFIRETFSKLDGRNKKVKAVLSYLAKNNYEYSLEPGDLKGDKLEDFFFNTKKGFCEHYAASVAYAFRVLGIPSRIVGGYQGGRYNSMGEYIIVTSRDAHAWVEFLSKDGHWKRVDPVQYIAPERITMGANFFYQRSSENLSTGSSRDTLLNELRLFVDLVYFNLNTYFLNYDKENQMELLTKIFGKKPSKFVLFSFMFSFFIVSLLVLYLVYVLNWRKAPYQRVFEKVMRKIERDSGVTKSTNLGHELYMKEISKNSKRLEIEYLIVRRYNYLKYAKGPKRDDFVSFIELCKKYLSNEK
ncbi:DUF3488 and transglutaminase-like domain-containing protein [Halobacteriovorax sp. GB3]|uniref:transglutaminase family protein n=1 Tax=Halobacteriovorax sp. GB3 TaxID=2719615 RepID=UPI00236212F7|nr:DUF3488 and transglutaminase-like domain-containing protein [Halobacteriovorax sp. GB3]MDD0853441.1 DUF3488 and transglutaminase-like domain-containing protein [Halobacteriovorax sp. GB3]